MPAVNEQAQISEQQYLQMEQDSPIKHELIDGQIHAMGGASINHVRISGNLFSEFKSHLKDSPCQAAIADLKVKIGTNYFYPDVLVDCDIDENDPYFSNKPVIIVEVLSKSTRRTDQNHQKIALHQPAQPA